MVENEYKKIVDEMVDNKEIVSSDWKEVLKKKLKDAFNIEYLYGFQDRPAIVKDRFIGYVFDEIDALDLRECNIVDWRKRLKDKLNKKFEGVQR